MSNPIDNTFPILWRIEEFPTLDSTNLVAADQVIKQWNAHTDPHGLVIAAAQQNAGKGQHGRAWASPAGGLYFSAVVAHLPPTVRDKLALITGVAVVNALQNVNASDIRLRWPNDILSRNKKIGGVLVEALSRGPMFAAVIGIGLNINTRLTDLPENIRPFATSLIDQDRQNRPLAPVRDAILQNLSAGIQEAITSGLAQTIERAGGLLFMPGELVIQTPAGVIRGNYQGLSQEADLLVNNHGHISKVSVGTLLSIDGRPIRPE